MNINSTKLFSAYEEMQKLVSAAPLFQADFNKVETIFEEKKNDPDAKIMVYGVYNAGKSTLINALIGKAVAAVDDIPTTDTVTSYIWKQYSIEDTPGVDAPIQHEEVTKAQMLKADAIICVVNPSGVAEEEKTLTVLLDLVQSRKQVFLVFNEKNNLSEDDFIKLKDQTRIRLQKLAAERGLTDILKHIPIVKVNAKRALNSRLENKEKLLASSGYYTLETELLTFLQSISPNEIYVRLKDELYNFSELYIKKRKDISTADFVKKYDILLEETEQQKSLTRKEIRKEIRRCHQRIYENTRALLRTSPATCQSDIESLFHEMSGCVSETLESEVKIFVGKIQYDIEKLQASLPPIKTSDQGVSIPKLNTAESDILESADEQNHSDISPEMMSQIVTNMTSVVKSEHIVGGLKLVKEYMPSLMKGIGTKTMEKWAGAFIGKYIPYIGTAVTIATSLWDIFSGDSEAAKLEKQIDDQSRQRERALQEIEDIARKLANDFESSIMEATNQSIDMFFANVSMQIEALRQDFSNEDRTNSETLEKALAIKQLILEA